MRTQGERRSGEDHSGEGSTGGNAAESMSFGGTFLRNEGSGPKLEPPGDGYNGEDSLGDINCARTKLVLIGFDPRAVESVEDEDSPARRSACCRRLGDCGSGLATARPSYRCRGRHPRRRRSAGAGVRRIRASRSRPGDRSDPGLAGGEVAHDPRYVRSSRTYVWPSAKGWKLNSPGDVATRQGRQASRASE